MADQVEIGKTATIEARFYADGVLTDDLPVTIGITKADGTVLIAAGTATTSGGVGIRRFALPAQPQVNLLKATWTGATQTVVTWVEVVGALLFTLAEARAWDQSAITTAIASDAQVLEERAQIADDFQRICGVSFFPRFARELHDGDGSCQLQLNHHRATSLLSVTVNGVAKNVADYTLHESGNLETTSNYAFSGSFTAGRRNIAVEYVHGHPQVLKPINRAAKIVARVQLVPSNIGDRATSIATDQGTIFLSTAGRGTFQPYGIPAVDSVLQRFDEKGVALVG